MEIDVNRSKDGVFYLLHGPKVEHLTSAPGYFANLTAGLLACVQWRPISN